MSRLISWLHRALGGAGRRVAILVAASALGVRGGAEGRGAVVGAAPAAASAPQQCL